MGKPKDPPPVQTEEIVILSVRNRRKHVSIEWQQGPDSVSRDFHENPLPSFYKALEGLAPHVCTVSEFPAGDAKKIVVLGATFREKGDNTYAVMVAKKKLKKGKRVLNVSTPILPMYADDENKSLDTLQEETTKALEKVIREVEKYLRGERAQGLINFPDGEDEEPEKGKKPEDPNQANLRLVEGSDSPAES